MTAKVMEHPRFTAEKAYQEHKASCLECSLPAPDCKKPGETHACSYETCGAVVRVMDLCPLGKQLWGAARGYEDRVAHVIAVDPRVLLD